jgi:cell wall assembly regulator SMI1
LATALKALRAGGKERPEKETPAGTGAEQPAEQSPAQPAPPVAPSSSSPEPPVREQAGAERTTREPKAKSQATVGVDRLPALLARLDAWLSEHRPRFAKMLLPGATPDNTLPEELRVWLAWHNGQSTDVPGAFVQSWHLLGTRRIAQLKKELDAEQSANWNSAWVPFLDDDNDNYVCLDTRQAGFPVRECWRGKQEHAVVADSLTAWVQQFMADLEKGAYVEDPERGEFYKKG